MLFKGSETKKSAHRNTKKNQEEAKSKTKNTFCYFVVDER